MTTLSKKVLDLLIRNEDGTTEAVVVSVKPAKKLATVLIPDSTETLNLDISGISDQDLQNLGANPGSSLQFDADGNLAGIRLVAGGTRSEAGGKTPETFDVLTDRYSYN